MNGMKVQWYPEHDAISVKIVPGKYLNFQLVWWLEIYSGLHIHTPHTVMGNLSIFRYYCILIIMNSVLC